MYVTIKSLTIKHVDYILREDGKISTAKEPKSRIVKKARLKNFSQRRRATRTKAIAGTRKLNCLIELSLPNELSIAQNLEIVSRFIAEHLSSHYYAYAIHEKSGELSGEPHPHVHIMFSERLIDDVERTNERPACKYFRRAAKPLKGEQVASFERRSQHGAPKDKKWHNKKYIYELRTDFARIQNEVLAKNGFSIRVDHRTLKAQQREAEKNGDDFTANLYKRMPESYE